MSQVIAIIGIGYVGLQNALNFSRSGVKVIAYDINSQRIKDLSQGIDSNLEESDVSSPNLVFTDDPEMLRKATRYLLSVPTPLNQNKVPDIHALKVASKMIAAYLKKDDLVVLESTVFPSATRELIIPILDAESGLVSGEDFFVGYSSERIVPGDEQLSLITTATKVISGQNAEAQKRILALYQNIPGLTLHCASSLEVAESSKLLENIQRNVNIALMNEFAQIMDKMNIPFHDVLEAAKTKGNFTPFTPGLVGGHCIPEDPYYLFYQADKLDCMHNLISAACQINQQFYNYIVSVLERLLIKQGCVVRHAKVALLGISFKSNVNDIRHSLSLNIYEALEALEIDVIACDPLVKTEKVNLNWLPLDELHDCDAMILCQAHKPFLKLSAAEWSHKLNQQGVFMDIPGAYAHLANFRQDICYWGL